MKHRQFHQRGFILVASIWVMAALVLMVGAFAMWVESSLDKAILQNHRATMQMHATSTKSVLLYLAATQSGTPAGIKTPAGTVGPSEFTDVTLDDFFVGADVDDMGSKLVSIEGTEISVDGMAYIGIGGSLFSVVDVSGLVPLNSRSPIHTEMLLDYLGIDHAKVQALASAVQDYIDKDDVLRPNGAEAFQYQQRGLPPPPNSPLLSRYELRNVLGWNSIENLWDNPQIQSALVAASTARYNVNAMPPIVAEIALGLSGADAELLVSEGRQQKYRTFKDLVDRTGLNLYPKFNDITVNPSNHLRFSFWYPEARLKREIDVYFPVVIRAGDSPWIVSRDLIVPVTESDALVEPRQPQTRLLR
ncbi:type II secretion system protein GspK [Alteromonas oceanisediminis]|uniref:type II secretion system protein GspK n=1 Tax=Alteromonas oceanisediminis TaxID=2836180 RepID=UPI001BD95D80|nr:type II secretion system protein GspK [Alteromonas oceanisediminis]MBT0585049.1 general secretion pathway protein GspK [Alteromonas oceanisediminis]